MSGGAPRWVVAGVTASGKSTVGRLLAERLGVAFVDGDDLHSPASLRRIHEGMPLTDADRVPWLDRIADRLAAPDGVVVACSALKRAYRDRLRLAAPGVRFAFLQVSPELARARAAARPGHVAPASLVESQFAALEVPGADEADVLVLDASEAASDLVTAAMGENL